jgi:tRNA A37 threonylcarbamoyladenosine dehydratase
MNETDWKCRTELIIGSENLHRLQNAHVLIAGLGGVGGYATEQLCRAGIGKLTIVDSDIVQPSNRNRQIIALTSTEEKPKIQVIAQRLKDINPEIEIQAVNEFLDENNIPRLINHNYDYVVDAIDTLSPKVALLAEAYRKGLRVVSSMGSGGRLDPSKIEVADISKSHHCKFAYIVRKYLHKHGIYEGIRVVYSTEPVPPEAIIATDGSGNKRSLVGTISYMPAIFGCYCAAEVIRDLISKD